MIFVPLTSKVTNDSGRTVEYHSSRDKQRARYLTDAMLYLSKELYCAGEHQDRPLYGHAVNLPFAGKSRNFYISFQYLSVGMSVVERLRRLTDLDMTSPARSDFSLAACSHRRDTGRPAEGCGLR